MGIDLKMELMNLMILFITLLAATATIAAAAQAKPGCRSQCGDVTIPYPFGTGNDCNISENFFITCDTTSTPHRAFLNTSTLEVVDISLDGQLTILGSVSYHCSPFSRASEGVNSWLSLAGFTVSNARNKFTAVGCDTFAFVQGDNEEYSIGCQSRCNDILDISDVINGSCSGMGCCQIAIPKGLGRGLRFRFGSFLSIRATQLRNNPCSYAFVAEDGAYNFSSSDIRGDALKTKEFPVILDWTIGDLNCSEAKKDKSRFACKENSNCVDSESGGGYTCKCFNGYEGNPYISDGCQGNNINFR